MPAGNRMPCSYQLIHSYMPKLKLIGMHKKLFLFLLLAGAGKISIAQTTDSVAHNELDEVVVSATKTEQKLGNVAVPVTVISKKTIQQNGSLRLNDILAEQAGLFITSDYSGTGVQMQGLNPDYTLILIDGEPIVGRNSGVLDLSRISITNIKRIEIVKGPSSSLYGSEAMAGIINIITEKPAVKTAAASVRYGSFGTADINASAGFTKNKFNLLLQGNYYRTDGYKLNSSSTANTQDPFHNYTLQLKAGYAFTPKTKWTLSTRYFNETQNIKPYSTKDASGNTETYSSNASIRDINVNNTFEHRFSEKVKTNLRIYYTNYKAETNQLYLYSDPSKNTTFYDYFEQNFTRFEDQTDIAVSHNSTLTAGAGWILDNVKSNRYDEKNIVTRNNNIGYAFTQYEWKPFKSWLFIAGARYDYNQRYESHLSPKLAIQKSFGDKLKINASIGGGFKAPDFRQLYLSFTNTAPGTGYTVLGNSEVQAGMKQLQQQGQIQNILIDPATIKELKPETSTGINIGANYLVSKAVSVNVNFFRNDINNLINTGTIAQKTNNMFVYSYFNINRVYTQGVEAEVKYQLCKSLQLSAGYQLLYTADKDDLDKIEAGKVFGRDANGQVYKVTKSDYKGLFNRSRHMANVKLYYEDQKGWFANARSIFRNAWGVSDLDGNLLLNRGDQFSNNFFQTNISVGKQFVKGFRAQVGCDNLFNYKDIRFMPNIPGRIVYATISYSFTQNQK